MEMCERHAPALETNGVTPHTPKGIRLNTAAVMNHNTTYLAARRLSYCCVFLVVVDIVTNCRMMTHID